MTMATAATPPAMPPAMAPTFELPPPDLGNPVEEDVGGIITPEGRRIEPGPVSGKSIKILE
jgi:hypothetical protein